jgi:hypothetical protein
VGKISSGKSNATSVCACSAMTRLLRAASSASIIATNVFGTRITRVTSIDDKNRDTRGILRLMPPPADLHINYDRSANSIVNP